MNRIFTTLIATTLAALCACISVAALAGNTNDLINRERLRGEKMAKEITKENDGFKRYKDISGQKLQDYQKLVQSIKEQHIKNAQASGLIKPAPQAVVFVSFSMPVLSLKQIIQDASRYQIPVVISGLYENSFRKTIEKIFDLVKENNKGGISINPLWFKNYDIKAVPAVVVSGGGYGSAHNGIDKKNDVVYGNIPLKRALTIIAQRGEAAKVAEDILNRSGR